MNQKKPTQKDLWKAQILEFFHQYFIGISNIECSEEYCPLVDNWNDLEKKQTKKGQAALYLISKTDNKWIPVNLINYEENDLGEYSNLEIQLKSGKTYRTKPDNYVKPENPEKKEIFLKPEEVILFFNNSTHTPNLLDAETIYLEDLWDIKEKIKWDQKASKKKIINWVEQKVDDEDKAYKIDQWENDYIFNIHNPDITNEIKAHEVYQAHNQKEREQLWTDHDKVFSELRRVYGIRHLTSKKEERQNNPEIELNEAQFIALERDKRREREKSIREVEEREICPGEHILTYGTSYEQREEKALEVKEIKEQEEQEENKKSEQSEQEKQILVKKDHDK